MFWTLTFSVFEGFILNNVTNIKDGKYLNHLMIKNNLINIFTLYKSKQTQ